MSTLTILRNQRWRDPAPQRRQPLVGFPARHERERPLTSLHAATTRSRVDASGCTAPSVHSCMLTSGRAAEGSPSTHGVLAEYSRSTHAHVRPRCARHSECRAACGWAGAAHHSAARRGAAMLSWSAMVRPVHWQGEARVCACVCACGCVFVCVRCALHALHVLMLQPARRLMLIASVA